MKNKGTYIAVFGENIYEYIHIILAGWLSNLKLVILTHRLSPSMMKVCKRLPLIGRYIRESVTDRYLSLGDGDKEAWLKINIETIELTTGFYDRELERNGRIIDHYNRILKTDKFPAYIKRELSNQVYTLLAALYAVRSSSDLKGCTLFVSRTPINVFVLDYMVSQKGFNNPVRWISPPWSAISLFSYYAWLLKECVRRGFVFNRPRKRYKISNEAAWGFQKNIPRNDMMIDNVRFKREDILILKQYESNDPSRVLAFEESKRRGLDVVSIPDLRINVNRDIFYFINFYFLVPVKIYARLLLKGNGSLSYYTFLFHKMCLPIEILMSRYSIGCHLSTRDWGDIAETMIFNKYGTKNAIIQWSDLTFYKAYNHVFKAHNIFFSWGDIHCDYQDIGSYHINRKVNVGCIYKSVYALAAGDAKKMAAGLPNFDQARKTVVFFDTSFAPLDYFNADFFIESMEAMEEFCRKHPDVNVLLKPKEARRYSEEEMPRNSEKYKAMCGRLAAYGNFTSLDPARWSAEHAIALSDVTVTMGVTTPSTIALICGKNALYYDRGNNHHPFAKRYKNTIVFDDRRLMFEQIERILSGKFACSDVMSEELLRQYDAFGDENAFDRIRKDLYNITK